MNLKKELKNQYKNLLSQMDYFIEDKEYSKDEINGCLMHVTDYIMSKSSKNNNISDEFNKCNDLINILRRNID